MSILVIKYFQLFHVLSMSVDCIVTDDNPLLDFISIKNLNLNFKRFSSKSDDHEKPKTNGRKCQIKIGTSIRWFEQITVSFHLNGSIREVFTPKDR